MTGTAAPSAPAAPTRRRRRSWISAGWAVPAVLLAGWLALVEVFWLPLRVGGVVFPVSVLAAVAGNLLLVDAAHRLSGSRAVARGVVVDGWLCVTAVTVDERYRRLGLATAVMAGLGAWARDRGARSCLLQVAGANTPALALYDRLGFTEHHRYHYRQGPDPGR